MALTEDTISINLAKGIDTKTDNKVAQPDQQSILQNARFSEDGEINKRYGLTAQGQTLQGDPGFLSPVAFGATSLKTKTFAHENQLCVANNGSLFSQYEGQNKWIFKGTYKPIGISSKQIDASIIYTDVGYSSGVSVSISRISKTISVFEEATGNLIATTTLSGNEIPVRVIGFSSAIYVLTTSDVAGHLNARSVSLTTGAVGGITSLKVDCSSANQVYAAVTSSSSTLGEVAFILYFSSSSASWKAFPMTTSATLPAIGARTLGLVSNTVAGITIEPSVNANKFYVADPGHVEAYTFTSGAYTNTYSTAWTPTTVSTAASTGVAVDYMHLTLALSPVNNTDLYVYLDTSPPGVGTLVGAFNAELYFSDDCAINMLSISAAGAINSNINYGYGYTIAGQAIRGSNSVYLPAQYISATQSTILILDTLQGRATPYNYPIGKSLYRLATGGAGNYYYAPGSPGNSPTVASLASFTSSSSNVSTGVYRIANSGYLIDFNLTPTYAAQNQYFANTSHLTGGFLWAYDGQSLSEHNFLIQPENFRVSTGTIAATVSVVTVGDGAHKETQDFTCRAAQFWLTNNMPAPRTSISLQFSTTAASYYLYCTVDGVGVDPAIGGRTKIGPVALLGTDTDQDVAGKIATAINAAGIAAGASVGPSLGSGNVVRVQNTANGAVTAPAVAGTAISNSGYAAGSYGYCFVYKWTDRNGQIYRSAPSVPISVTLALNESACLNMWAPPITCRVATTITIEVYRTQVNGSEYQLIGNFLSISSTPLTILTTSSRAYAFDTIYSDASLNTQPILYTNGGILENASIPACSTIGFFKDRLIVNSSDDIFAVFYSKTNVKGEPVNFSEDTFFRIDAEASAVSGVTTLDDKLCAFKKSLVYVVSGDGADDLGNNSTFSPPMKIAADVGCENPNSIVLYPNGLLFKSDKGIYELNRSLGVQYKGSPVEQYNSNVTSGAVLMESVTEIRFTLSDSSTGLIYNYFYNRWDTFTNYQADSACVWQNKICLASNAGVVSVEGTNYYDVDVSAVTQSYSMYLKTPWLRLKGVQDFQRIKRLSLLGEYLTPHTLTVKVYYDFDSTLYTGNTYTFTGADLVTGTFPGDNVYQPQILLNQQKCQSIMLEIYETPISGNQSSLKLSEIGATVGLKKGLFKVPARKVQ